MARATNDSTEKKTRPRKTPAERAQLDYDKAKKASDAAVAKLEKIRTGIAEAEAEVARTQRYLDYASRNPDLPAQPTDEPADEAADEPVEMRELQPA